MSKFEIHCPCVFDVQLTCKCLPSEQLNICPKQTESFSDFGKIKHLLDRAKPYIRFVVQIKVAVQLGFASSNISPDVYNKSNVRLGSVQQVYYVKMSKCLSLVSKMSHKNPLMSNVKNLFCSAQSLPEFYQIQLVIDCCWKMKMWLDKKLIQF